MRYAHETSKIDQGPLNRLGPIGSLRGLNYQYRGEHVPLMAWKVHQFQNMQMTPGTGRVSRAHQLDAN